MTQIGPAAALALVFSFTGALAQTPQQVVPDLRSRNIEVEYYEPRDPQLQKYYDRLQKRKVLEELGQFLAPVKWPKTLRLIMKQCSDRGSVSYNYDEYSLIICYQFFPVLEQVADAAPAKFGSFANPREVLVGGLVGMVLHEAGRATFDMLQVPLLGSDQDAGDQIASLIGLQFGPQVARAVIKGTYLWWITFSEAMASQNLPYNLAGRASIEPQRAVNTLCIAYGSPQSAAFKDLVDKGLLPQSRAGGCADEYKQAAAAFVKTVKPHVDQDLMSKALAMCASAGAASGCWITPEDLR